MFPFPFLFDILTKKETQIMNILFLDSPSFGNLDMIAAFEKNNINVSLFSHEKILDYLCKEFDDYFDNLVSSGNYSAVFSFNYYPSLSSGCMRNNIKYLAFVYDSPLVRLYSYTLINPCNYVFLFDKVAYLDFANAGIQTVYYLPLCANTSRLSSITTSSKLKPIVSSDVSFVGSLYNEDHNFFDRMVDLDPYTRGYLDALMRAQKKISGYSFIEELLTPEILSAMKKALPLPAQPGGAESDSYLYAYYVVARKLSSIEREEILSAVSSRYKTKLYTHNPTPHLPDIQNMGAVDYYDTMPHIFKHSKINLNITLRSIRSGIPLRAFDIMGCEGFLLTNYQEDFLDFFVPNEDFVYYDGTEDMLSKIDYYLSHNKERLEIAHNGFSKIQQYHTYENRVLEMLTVADLKEALK